MKNFGNDEIREIFNRNEEKPYSAILFYNGRIGVTINGIINLKSPAILSDYNAISTINEYCLTKISDSSFIRKFKEKTILKKFLKEVNNSHRNIIEFRDNHKLKEIKDKNSEYEWQLTVKNLSNIEELKQYYFPGNTLVLSTDENGKVKEKYEMIFQNKFVKLDKKKA